MQLGIDVIPHLRQCGDFLEAFSAHGGARAGVDLFFADHTHQHVGGGVVADAEHLVEQLIDGDDAAAFAPDQLPRLDLVGVEQGDLVTEP